MPEQIAQRLLHELHVPTDAPIRQEIVAEKDIPETPVADVRITGKNKMTATEGKPSQTPVVKEKQTLEKKPKEKEKEKIPGERLRLTASCINRPERYRFET